MSIPQPALAPPLAAICKAASAARCSLCCTEPGEPCTHPDGYHVARFCTAWRCGLLAITDLDAVFTAANGFSNATVIYADGA